MGASPRQRAAILHGEETFLNDIKISHGDILLDCVEGAAGALVARVELVVQTRAGGV